jgi:hypothetical protein
LKRKKNCFDKNSCWTSGRIFYRHKISNLDEKKFQFMKKREGVGTPTVGTPKVEIDQNSESQIYQNSESLL